LGLRRDLSGRRIVVEPEEVEFSVNYGFVSEILGAGKEDLQDRLADLAELVPDFPIDAGEFRDFWNGFRMIAPGLPLADELPRPRRRKRQARETDEVDQQEAAAAEPAAPQPDPTADRAPQRRRRNVDEPEPLELVDFYVPAIPKDGPFRLLPAVAIILGRRTGHTFSALRELDGMARQPLDRTAFGCVFDPASARPPEPHPSSEVVLEDAFPLPLTLTQEAVVRSARTAPLTVVTGPPGTGKSYTITAIVLDSLLCGRSVLVASQMDKAVEVVARQVEEIAGPFAIARSGGRAAQRELAEKITRLTGPRTRLRTVSEHDRRETAKRHGRLSERLATLEQRYRSAVGGEQVWSECRESHARLAPVCPLPVHEISAQSYRRAKAAARRARESLEGEPPKLRLPVQARSLRTYVRAKHAARRARELLKGKPGRISRWWARRLKRRALRLFGIKSVRDCSLDEIGDALRRWWGEWNKARALDSLRVPSRWDCSLEELDEAVLVQGHFATMREMERQLRVVFPADLLWEEIEHLQRQRTDEALRLLRLNREAALHELTGNKEHRGELRLFRTLLRRRDRKLKRQLREKIGLSVPLSAFPGWACTNRSLGQILPATGGTFDLVVIDETSQCQLATAAVALLRGKRAVVVGDPNQLRHVCFLGKAREQASFARHGLAKDVQERFRYRRSLFDVAADAVEQDHFFMLDQHFRSDPHIIVFSNQKFYRRELRIMTERPRRQAHSAIRVVQARGRRSEGTSINPAEVESVLREVAAVVEGGGGDGPVPTLGIVCPFRDQVDAIRERLIRQFPAAAIDRHEIVVGTAHSLQGDEKDLIIFSTSIDPGFHSASLRFLENPNLFNVAVTRARHQQVVVTSVAIEDLPAGLLREYLPHAEGTMQPHHRIERYGNQFEEHLAAELKKQGLGLWPSFPAAGVRIPLVASKEEGHLAFLCDGPPADPPAGPADRIDPLRCHRVLARAGWVVKRIPQRSWLTGTPA